MLVSVFVDVYAFGESLRMCEFVYLVDRLKDCWTFLSMVLSYVISCWFPLTFV